MPVDVCEFRYSRAGMGTVARGLTLLIMLLASGCASIPPKPPESTGEKAGGAIGGAVGAVGGATLGATLGVLQAIQNNKCGSPVLAVACVPVFGVIDGATGLIAGGAAGAKLGEQAGVGVARVIGSVGQAESSSSTIVPVCVTDKVQAGDQINLPDGHRAVIKTIAGRSSVCPERTPVYASMYGIAWRESPGVRSQIYVAEISSSDAMPLGKVYVVPDTRQQRGDDTVVMKVLINFNSRSSDNEMSYVAEALAACKSGSLSIIWWRTYELSDGAGMIVTNREPSPSILVTRPSPPLASVVQAACDPQLAMR